MLDSPNGTYSEFKSVCVWVSETHCSFSFTWNSISGNILLKTILITDKHQSTCSSQQKNRARLDYLFEELGAARFLLILISMSLKN
jgi:hypothetical protein